MSENVNQDLKYFTVIPNMLDDMGLSVYAFRLYAHIKRVAGENGKCFQSTATLADECDISINTVTKVKQELLERGLISIVPKNVGRGKPLHVITVVDIWNENMQKYAKN
jgi:DNA-binding transcriptional MocR family regulator